MKIFKNQQISIPPLPLIFIIILINSSLVQLVLGANTVLIKEYNDCSAGAPVVVKYTNARLDTCYRAIVESAYNNTSNYFTYHLDTTSTSLMVNTYFDATCTNFTQTMTQQYAVNGTCTVNRVTVTLSTDTIPMLPVPGMNYYELSPSCVVNAVANAQVAVSPSTTVMSDTLNSDVQLVAPGTFTDLRNSKNVTALASCANKVLYSNTVVSVQNYGSVMTYVKASITSLKFTLSSDNWASYVGSRVIDMQTSTGQSVGSCTAPFSATPQCTGTFSTYPAMIVISPVGNYFGSQSTGANISFTVPTVAITSTTPTTGRIFFSVSSSAATPVYKYFSNGGEFTCGSTTNCASPNVTATTPSGPTVNLTVTVTSNGMESAPATLLIPLFAALRITGVAVAVSSLAGTYLPISVTYSGGGPVAGITYTVNLYKTQTTAIVACSNIPISSICNATGLQTMTYYKIEAIATTDGSGDTYYQLATTNIGSSLFSYTNLSPSSMIVTSAPYTNGPIATTATVKLGSTIICSYLAIGNPCTVTGLSPSTPFTAEVSFYNVITPLSIPYAFPMTVTPPMLLVTSVPAPNPGSSSATVQWSNPTIGPIAYYVLVNGIVAPACNGLGYQSTGCTAALSYTGFHNYTIKTTYGEDSVLSSYQLPNFAPTLSFIWYTDRTVVTISPINVVRLRYSFFVGGVPVGSLNQPTSTFTFPTVLDTIYNVATNVSEPDINPNLYVPFQTTFSPISLKIPIISLVSQTSSSLNIKFQSAGGNSGLTKYTVSMNGTNVTSCVDISAIQCPISGLLANQTYTFIVTSTNNDMIQINSNNFKTLPYVFSVVPTFKLYSTAVMMTITTSPTIATPLQFYSIVLDSGSNSGSGTPVFSGLGPSTTHSVNITIYSVYHNTYVTQPFQFTTLAALGVTVTAPQYVYGSGALVASTSTTGSVGPFLYTFNLDSNPITTCINLTTPQCSITGIPTSEIASITVSTINDYDIGENGYSFSTYNITTMINFLVTSRYIYFNYTYSQVLGIRGESTGVFLNGGSIATQQSSKPEYQLQVIVPPNSQLTLGVQYQLIAQWNNILLSSSSIVTTSFKEIIAPVITTPTVTSTSIVVSYPVTGGAPTEPVYYNTTIDGIQIPSCFNSIIPNCTISTTPGFHSINVMALSELKTVQSTLSPIVNVQILTNIDYISASDFKISITPDYSFIGYMLTVNRVTFNCPLLVSSNYCIVNGLTPATTVIVSITGYGPGSNSYTIPTPIEVTTLAQMGPLMTQLIKATPTEWIVYHKVEYIQQGVNYTVSVNGTLVGTTQSNETSIPVTVNSGGSGVIVVNATYFGDLLSSTITVTNPLLSIPSINMVLVGKTSKTATISFTTTNTVFNPNFVVTLQGKGVLDTCIINTNCLVSGLIDNTQYIVYVNGTFQDWIQSSTLAFTTFSSLKSTSISTITSDSQYVQLNVTSVGGDPSNTIYTILNGVSIIQPNNISTYYSYLINPSYPWYQFKVIATYDLISKSSLIYNYVALKLNVIIGNQSENGINVIVTPSYQLDPKVWNYVYSFNNGLKVTGCQNNCIINGLSSGTDYIMTVSVVQANGQVVQQVPIKTLDKFIFDKILIVDYDTTWITIKYTATGGDPTTPTTYVVLLNGQSNNQCSSNTSTCKITGLSNSVSYNITVVATNGNINLKNELMVSLPTGADLTVQPIALTKSIGLSYPLRGVIANVVYYNVSINNVLSTVCDTLVPSCMITQLTPNTAYQIKVVATYVGDTATKTITSQSTVNTFALVSSPLIQVVKVTTSIIGVNVSITGGAPSLDYSRGFSINGTNQANCIDGLCLFSGLQPGTTYSLTATAGNDGTSTLTTIIVPTYSVITISLLDPYQRDGNGIYVDFTTLGGVPNITTYSININGQQVCNSSTVGKCYYPIQQHQVWTIDLYVSNDGISVSSSTQYQSYPSPAPSSILASSSTSSSITYSWTVSESGGIPNATYYEAQLSYDNVSWGSACVTNATQCTINKLLDTTNYLARVAVRNRRFDPILSPSQTVSTSPVGPVGCPSPCLNNGTCTGGYCVCLNGWDGPTCSINTAPASNSGSSSKPPEVTKIQVSENSTSVGVQNKYVTFEFAMASLVERDVDGLVVESVDLRSTQWKLIINLNESVVHPVTNETFTRLLYGFVSESGLMTVNFTQFIPLNSSAPSSPNATDSFPVTFAGETFNVKLGSLKYSVRVEGWQFASMNNTMDINCMMGDIGQDSTIEMNEGSVMSTLLITDKLGNKVYSRLLNRVLVDNFPMRASHNATKIVNGTMVTSTIPAFRDSFEYDPDLSLLVMSDDKNDNMSQKNWTGVAVGVTVGVVGAAVIIGGVMYYLKKHKHEVFTLKRRFRTSISLKDWSRHK